MLGAWLLTHATSSDNVPPLERAARQAGHRKLDEELDKNLLQNFGVAGWLDGDCSNSAPVAQLSNRQKIILRRILAGYKSLQSS
jgi:DNA-binding NarL/FixJ family response regulator